MEGINDILTRLREREDLSEFRYTWRARDRVHKFVLERETDTRYLCQSIMITEESIQRVYHLPTYLEALWRRLDKMPEPPEEETLGDG